MRQRFTRPFLSLSLALALVLGSNPTLEAATPSSGTITPTTSVTWDGFSPLTPVASLNESTCIEGTNCDTFNLTVGGVPADWVGKIINVRIDWTLGANDYDLVIHKDSNSGPEIDDSGDAPPVTTEAAAINPSATGTGLYTVHVIYFAVAPGDPYVGTATVGDAPVTRSANYVKGGIGFSPDTAVKAPAARADGEPSNRTDEFGNHYVAGIRGVPAGTDLWYFDLRPGSPDYDPWMRNPVYRGQPDEFLLDDDNALSVGADGGGDIDLAVGFGGTDPPNLAAVSLVAANISAMRSTDRGDNWTLNPVGSQVPVDDRQWIEAFGPNSVYLYYRTISVPVNHFIQRSDDGGLTYGPPVFIGINGQTGYIDVDQNDGTVYASRQTGSTITVAVGTPPAPGLAPVLYTDHVAVSDATGVNNIFAPVKVADDGTVYVAYSNGSAIFLAHSVDKGKTWAQPVRVSDGPDTATSLMPWIETGALPGSVAVVWYGTSSATNSDAADWNVFFAQTLNAKATSPTFRQVIASDHVIHGSNISLGGLLGSANRNLLDYFQVSIDPVGAAVIGYTSDHNDFNGHTFVTRQISGPSFSGGNVPDPGPPPPPTPPAADGSQVQDFAQDHVIGLLGMTPTNSPFDVLSIKYSCEDTEAGKMLVATMSVSDLPAVVPGGNWRINFAANAPNSVMSPTGEYTFGLSDRGSQFFLRASTDLDPAGVFTYGTAVRASGGGLTYTTRGNADFGGFDSAAGTITLKVLLSKLNPFVTAGPPVAAGSTLVGLRGQTFTPGVNGITDIARGGTQYTIPEDCTLGPPPPVCGDGVVESPEECDDGNTVSGDGCSATCKIESASCGNGIVEAGEECDGAADTACPGECSATCTCPVDGGIKKVTGGGGIGGKSINFGFNADSSLSGHVNYHDKVEDIHLVSDSILSFVQTGANEVTFSGTGRVGSTPVTFEITVVDNGEPGSNDQFRIEITGGLTSSQAGPLTRGNIQVHR